MCWPCFTPLGQKLFERGPTLYFWREVAGVDSDGSVHSLMLDIGQGAKLGKVGPGYARVCRVGTN